VVVALRKAIAAIILVAFAGGCTDEVTHREKIRTSFGEVILTVSSVGTALDGERYDLTFRNGSKEQKFFTGWNFSEFHAGERGGKLLLQMCHGWIERAEPISVGAPTEPRLVRLNIDWNCKDQANDA
jgi:hypothetical protein